MHEYNAAAVAHEIDKHNRRNRGRGRISRREARLIHALLAGPVAGLEARA